MINFTGFLIIPGIRYTFARIYPFCFIDLEFNMRRLRVLFFVLLVCLLSSKGYAQIGEVLRTFLSDSNQQSGLTVAPDSGVLKALRQQVSEAKLAEMSLRLELEQSRKRSLEMDSVKLAGQKRRIDSLRAITQGIPVVVNEDTLFSVYAKRGGLGPVDRAELFAQNIDRLGRSYGLHPDSVYLEPTEHVTDIMYGNKVLVSLTDLDGLWQNMSRAELADAYRQVVVGALHQLKEDHSWAQLAKRSFWFVLVFVIQYFLYRLTTWLYRRVKKRILRLKDTRLKPFSIHEYELLNTGMQVKMLTFGANMVRYLVVLLQLLVTVPVLFSIFPQTEDLAIQIFSYLLTPIRAILRGIVDYIPKLFTIIVIYLAIHYVIKVLKYLANEIDSGKLKINGFYQDWAHPTFHIVRFLLYAFMVAMIYPYLPGADSGIFQGISVFVGLIVSLGSSTVIGNIIAGLVITYMRPFKIGDRIKLNETTGNVIEKTAFVTRLQTPKNELVTIPNSFIMSSHTVNYSSSARTIGLIIHSEVTIGYDAPWRKVHGLLMAAAKATPGVLPEPEPFVLETSLSDWYPVYQINAYIRDADQLARIYSDLHQNIQDKFNEAGVEIMSPHYIATRDGNESTIPREDYR